MHGVPENLDLSRFKGASLIQIGMGEHQLQFHFLPDAHISVEGSWTLFDRTGQVVDRSMDNAVRSEYRIHLLLGKEVVGFEVDAPHSFSLEFADGHKLQVNDDSDEYESFSIQPGDLYV